MSNSNYRPDIDGLRAVAVGSVVIYHALPFLAPGGFVGVDIFFVISGYLISQILYTDLAADRFSLIDFYVRRVRRILPALVVVLLACCLVANWFLLADELDAFARSQIASASFVANIFFWRNTNYFSGLAVLQPLLHLWSLSVEEQFYLVWPLALAVTWRLRASPLVIAGLVAAGSFLWSVQAAEATPIAAFFAPQSRAWELMAGAILAWTMRRRNAPPLPIPTALLDAGSAAAHALIFYAILFTRTEAFPGLSALPVVVGAVLIIACGPHALANRAVLARPGFVWVGLISYPLYLWHWPLLSFLRIVKAAPTSLSERIVCVATAVGLAWLTYVYVERPIRFGARNGWKPLALTASLLAFVALGAAAKGGAFDAAPLRSAGRAEFARAFENVYPDWRYNAREKIAKNFRLDCNFYDPAFLEGAATRIPIVAIDRSCYERDPQKRRVAFLWGDSHAQMLYGGLRDTLPNDWQILIVASSACAPDPNMREDSATDFCRRSNAFAMRAIADARPDVIIVARVDGHRYGDMRATGEVLRALGAGSVLFTGPVPQWDAPLAAIEQRRLWAQDPERTKDNLDAGVMRENQRLREDFARAGDDRLVDLVGVFCNDQGCLTRVGPDRMRDFVTFDYGHLTPPASRFLARGLLAARVERAAGDSVSVLSSALDKAPGLMSSAASPTR
jgi:peptidoglycan/LPS O-acetylase OafA/YrhL